MFSPENREVTLIFNDISARFKVENYNQLQAVNSVFDSKHEDTMLKPMLHKLQSGDVAFDVGANLGV